MQRDNMLNRKIAFGKAVGSVVAIGLMLGSASLAQASPLVSGTVAPTITAGAPPDTPSAHIDPNVSSSRFSGVVSINIRYDGQSYICSGALVGKRQVVSAGHCVDTTGNGVYVDLKKPGTDVRVLFNSNGNYNTNSAANVITATQVAVHKDYQGFNNCPDGTRGCVNDDVAVITLGKDAPASAKIYKVAVTPLNSGTHITMAGYGTSGDGVNGFTILPSFSIKRSGENYVDLFDLDDELNGEAGNKEVFYADFDGGGRDTFCTYFDACSPQLANNLESGIGGGDSGGPSFIELYGELMLVANNTFSGRFPSLGYAEGTFGTYFGGMILSAYTDFLYDATGGNITFVPEPASAALMGLGSLFLLGSRRRRSAK